MESASSLPPREGYQAQGHAWDPMRDDILALLRGSSEDGVEPIYYGSNHTFLVTLDGGDAGSSYAVYKPSRGEYPLYDFPSGTLYKREIGSYLVSSLLGWDLVPPTVEWHGRLGVGSLQLFIESYSSGDLALSELFRMALLDLILNNADRKGEHCLLGESGKLWGIDHGLTFHAQPKLRTVLWHFAGEPIAEDDLDDLNRLLETVRRGSDPEVRELRRLMSPMEWRALINRVERVAQSPTFPNPRYKAVPYRW